MLAISSGSSLSVLIYVLFSMEKVNNFSSLPRSLQVHCEYGLLSSFKILCHFQNAYRLKCDTWKKLLTNLWTSWHLSKSLKTEWM
jgi:hypothetical protein